MSIYKRPTLLQKSLKAVETYSRLTRGSALDVRIAITETAILQGERWSKVMTEMAPLGLCSCNRPPYPQPQEGPGTSTSALQPLGMLCISTPDTDPLLLL